MILWDELQPYIGAADSDELMAMAMEAAAVAMLERKTHRYFGGERENEAFIVGRCQRYLRLPGPVVEETEAADITVEERYYVGDDWRELEAAASDGWELRGDKLIRARGMGWCAEYRVTYPQGYGVGEEPVDVREAVRQLTKWMFDKQQASAINSNVGGEVESETIGDYSYTRGGGSSSTSDTWQADLPFVVGVINTWKRLSV